MKDAQGNQITAREFFSRWKEGINNVTPLQQTNISIGGNVLVLIGVLIGLFSTWNTKWLFIILLGSLVLVLVQFVSTIQRWIQLKEIQAVTESLCKEVKENVTIKESAS